MNGFKEIWMWNRFFAGSFLLIALTSCAVFAPEKRTDLNDRLPQKFSLYSSSFDSTNQWWSTLGSTELNHFVEEALTNSPSLQQAWARLAQVDALARQAGAARFPVLNYAGNAGVSRNSIQQQNVEAYSLGLNAAYEVDLWGRIKSQTEAANLDRAASREQLHTAAITLSSQVTLRWLGIVAQRLQTDLIRRQLEINKTSLDLIELRFRKSLATALDVYQQRQAVAGTKSRIPQAELREKLLENELAVLLGRSDLKSLQIAQTNLPSLGPLPKIGLPADVLANRPDVRQAGLRLQSADWRVSAAKADRLPAIRLTASANYANADFSSVFDDWFANLAAGVTGPIFDGGRRKAEVDRARAVVDERLAAYRETVLRAIKEVEDALVSEKKQREYIVALDRNIVLSRHSYREAVRRYQRGLINYLPVLLELVTLQNLERDRVVAQYTLLQYRINLYRALGGTWPENLHNPFSTSKEKL